MYLDTKFSTLQVDLPRYASVNMYLQQYWYLVVYRIYGSRTRYTAGSQQISRSPWPYAVGSVSKFFYIENLYETLCMVFMRDRADRAVLDTAWYKSSIIFHINWIPCLPPLAPRVGVVAPEHSDRNFV